MIACLGAGLLAAASLSTMVPAGAAVPVDTAATTAPDTTTTTPTRGATVDPTTSSTTPATAPAPNASVTFVQGFDPAGDAVAVDVILDERICALRSVAVGSVARRLSVPAGRHTFAVLLSDGRCTSDVLLGSVTVDSPGGEAVSLLLHGDGAGALAVSSNTPDRTATADGSARVTIDNRAGTSVRVALRPLDAGTDLELVDLADLGASTRGHGVEVQAGGYTLEVATTSADGATTVTTSVAVTLVPGQVLDVYVLDVDAVPVQPDGDDARARSVRIIIDARRSEPAPA